MHASTPLTPGLNSPTSTYTLDASTAYLYSQTAAANVHAYNPEAKVIAVLRNPVPRAYSHYNMALLYESGEDGIRDVNKAVLHYALAAQSGIPDAQLKLSSLFSSGRYVLGDTEKALAWMFIAGKPSVKHGWVMNSYICWA